MSDSEPHAADGAAAPVREPSAAAEALRAFPPVVYAPTTTVADGSPGLEMLRLADGRTALFVYSAVDRLRAWWREDSPWVLMGVVDLQRAHDAVPFDVLFLDRRPHPPDDEPVVL